MQLVQAVKNVQIPLVSVLVMLVTRVPNVILLVVVIQLVQAALHVIRLQVNVLAILVTQEPHVTPVTPTTIKQVMELVKVSLSSFYCEMYSHFKRILKSTFSSLACGCDSTGSSSQECADTTGTCTCNAGYKGTKCDTACGCDTTGSSSTSCDQSTGQCTCNTGYTGTTCNTCDTNYYTTGVGTTCAGKSFSFLKSKQVKYI